jgi:hypothetical protein
MTHIEIENPKSKIQNAWILALALTALLAPRCLKAAEPTERPLEYRRYFVPADRPQEWPKRNTTYLPVDREEFEQLVEAANAKPRLKAAAKAALTRANYSANFKEPDLLVGEARFELAHLGDKPALVALDPFGLSLAEARWSDATPAIVGVEVTGKLAVLVERAETLVCKWSLHGRREGSGAIQFPLDLPPAAVCQFDLELPDSLRPSLDGVAVLDSTGQDDGKWRYQLGGPRQSLLRIEPSDARVRSRRLVLLEEKATYRLLPGGIDLAAQLRLDVHSEPLRRLDIDLDSPLRIVGVQFAGTEIPWMVPPDSRPNESHVAIEFPEPLIGAARVVTVTALAPLEIDVPVKLPRLRVRDVAWQAGDITLATPAPLALDSLLPQGCRQTKVAPFTGGSLGEGIELQLFSPEATVAVQVSRRRTRAQLTGGTTLRFAPDSVRSEFRGRMEAVEGELFVVQAEVAAGWEIDSVTADRPGALANWNLHRSTRPAMLVLQLAEPVTASLPLELLISGHRRSAPEARFSSATLEMLRFRDVADQRRLLALETSAGQRIAFEGVDRPRLRQRLSLSEADRKLLASALSEEIFEVDADRSLWDVVMVQQSPRYSADIHATIEVEPEQFSEDYRIRCQPEGSRVDRLLLSFSQARDEAPLFSGDDELGSIAAQRLTADERAATGAQHASEAWLLRLAKPVAQPFEVHARRASAGNGNVVPAMLAVPDAANQQGSVEIRFTGPALAIESAERLEPISPQPPTIGESLRPAAAFRYDPLDELDDRSPAALVLSPATEESQPVRANVWRLQLNSHYPTSGESHHVAVFEIENRGASHIVLGLPSGSTLLGAQVDGVMAARRSEAAELKLPLPAERSFTTVVVDFLLPTGRLSFTAHCKAPWPAVDLPVLTRQWYLSTSTQYEAISWRPLSNNEQAWPTRLLGPLGRPTGQSPFNPARWTDWRKIWAAAHPDETSVVRGTKLLEALGATLASSDVDDWKDLLLTASTAEPALFTSLRVDWRSLAVAGVRPSLHVSRFDASDASRTSSAVLGTEELRLAGLALLVAADKVMLTTRSTAAEVGEPNLGDPRTVLFKQTPERGPLTPMATAAIADCPLSVWLDAAETAWDTKIRPASFHFEGAASVFRLEQADGGESSVRLVRRDVVVSAGWALGALVVALGSSVRRGQRILLPLVASLAALAAIWLPPPLMPLAWGTLIGSLAAAWLVLRPTGRSTDASLPRPATTAMTGASGLVATGTVLLLLAFIAVARGQEVAPTEAAGAAPTIHRVFVPVDADGKQGPPYQVPTGFLNELRRRANLASQEPRGWLITTANYECTLDREGLDGPIIVKRFTARFDLQVFGAEMRIRLPFHRRQAQLVDDSPTLDGQPIDLTWSDDGQELLCDVFEPGVYELEFALAPTVATGAELGGLDLSIPKIALARLDVWLPAEGLALDLPGIKGSLELLESGRKVSAELGPVDTLVLRWPQRAATMPVAEVEELLWLKVQPGSVVLDVTLNLNVTNGILRQVEFAADRRLRLVPGPLVGKDRTKPLEADTPDAPLTTQLDFDPGLAGQSSLRLSFLMTGASGVGNIRLPAFHTRNARLVRRWLAVTVDPGLEYEARDAERLDPLPAADFAARWGEADAALREAMVYRLNDAETAWNLATRSREPQTTVKESLSLSFQRSHALVRYDAQLTTSAGFVFQHRLLVPAEIEVERLTLDDGSGDRVSRWSRSENGVVTVFLNRRTTGAQLLTLTGRMPVRASGRVNLPVVTFERSAAAATTERAEILARTIHLYRQPTVRIALEDATGLAQPPEPSPEPFDARLGRLVLSRAAESAYSGVVVVSPNDPQLVEFQQVTQLRYSSPEWVAEISYRFIVEGGVLDTLRFDLPATWAANVEVSSPTSLAEILDQPGGSRKELTLRPLAPLTGDCQVKLRTSLKFAPGETVAAPEVVALDVPAGERYWLLPQQVGIEAVSWDVERLTPAALPKDMSAVAPESSLVFRAAGDRPRAVMAAVKASADLARVRLADVYLDCSGGRPTGAAAFDVEPGGNVHCRLALAAGWRLLQVRVGGIEALPIAAEPDKWDVPLHSNRLPQRIEVTFSLDGPRTSPSLSLPVVRLDEWPVEETLLTVQPPGGAYMELAGSRTDLAACALARLGSVVELTNLPAETVATTAADDLAAWYAPWAQWLVYCGQQEQLLKPAAEGAVTRSRPQPLRSEWMQTARRLHVETVLDNAVRAPLPPTTAIWQQLHESRSTTCYRWSGLHEPGEIRVVAAWRGWLERATASLWIGTIFLGAVLLPRRFGMVDVLRRWPHACGVAVGLSWWLFCQPSWAGWLLIVASLLAGLRSALRPLPSRLSVT